MRCQVPVDLLRVVPRIFGNFDVTQAAGLGSAGLSTLAAISGDLPAVVGFLLAALCLAFGLLDIDGIPLHRLTPRLLSYLLTLADDRRSSGDDPLWLVPQRRRGPNLWNRIRTRPR